MESISAEWDLTMNYYKVLQIDKTASCEEIKKAYRKLSRKYHPDNVGDESRNLFDQVQEAYAILGDEEKKAAYDRKLAGEGINRQSVKVKKESKQQKENNYRDMAAFFGGKYQNSFEQFFGFSPESKQKNQSRGADPVNTDKLFEAFFKVK